MINYITDILVEFMPIINEEIIYIFCGFLAIGIIVMIKEITRYV